MLNDICKENMLDTFNLTVLKVEAFEEVLNAKVSIFESGSLKDEILMTSPTVHPVLISAPQIQIKLHHPSLSVSFSPSLFQTQGLHYLPLSTSASDFLYSLPVQVPLPRILIDIHPQIFSPPMNLTESSDLNYEFYSSNTFDEISQMKIKNTELKIQVEELENVLVEIKEKHQKEIEEISLRYKKKVKELSEEIEKLRVIQAKNLKISADVIRENSLIKEKIEEVTKEREEINEKLQRYTKLHDDSQVREDSILMILEIKDKEIMRLRKRYSSENFHTQKMDSIKLNNRSGSLIRRCENTEEQSINKEKIKKFKRINERALQMTQTMGIEGILQLSEELIYIIGSKKVNVMVKKDVVYVRIGTCLKTLEGFLSNNCAQEVQNFKLKKKKGENRVGHKKSNTLFDIEKIENSLVCKSFDGRMRSKLLKTRTPRNSSSSLKTSSPVSHILTARNINII